MFARQPQFVGIGKMVNLLANELKFDFVSIRLADVVGVFSVSTKKKNLF